MISTFTLQEKVKEWIDKTTYFISVFFKHVTLRTLHVLMLYKCHSYKDEKVVFLTFLESFYKL